MTLEVFIAKYVVPFVVFWVVIGGSVLLFLTLSALGNRKNF